jgi:hypothetical protein
VVRELGYLRGRIPGFQFDIDVLGNQVLAFGAGDLIILRFEYTL